MDPCRLEYLARAAWLAAWEEGVGIPWKERTDDDKQEWRDIALAVMNADLEWMHTTEQCKQAFGRD